MVNPTQALTQSLDVVIANGASLSDPIRLAGNVLAGVHMPAAWTAASLTFQVSNDGTTWRNLFDAEGTEVEVVATAGVAIILDTSSFLPWRHMRIRSGTSALPVNQGADRTIIAELGRPVAE